MTKKMPVGRPFQKGQSGNPGGKPKLSQDLKEIPQITTHELQRIISKYFRMNKGDISLAGTSETLPMIEIAIARTIHTAAKNGDYFKLIPLVERICGKVVDIAEVHQYNYDPALDELPKENIINMLKAVNEG